MWERKKGNLVTQSNPGLGVGEEKGKKAFQRGESWDKSKKGLAILWKGWEEQRHVEVWEDDIWRNCQNLSMLSGKYNRKIVRGET